MKYYENPAIEGEFLLGFIRTRGLWVAESRIKGRRVGRLTGVTSTSTTSHGLLSIALVNSLKDLGYGKPYEKLASMSPTGKPRLFVKTTHPTYADAMQALLVSEPPEKPLRAAESLREQIRRQTARFDLQFIFEPNNFGVTLLQQWATNFLLRNFRDDVDWLSLSPNLITQTSKGLVVGDDLDEARF